MSINIRIIARGFDRASRKMNGAASKLDSEFDKKSRNIGFRVSKTAKKYAKRGTRPGGDLERSIIFRVGKGFVRILVPDNSKAGRYAKIQHDKRFTGPNKGRGPGTRRKGAKADWKFITRAIRDEKPFITRQYKSGFKVLTA
ncbi:MAG: hypothetical protein KAS32_24665 [Candidatus Peribacteraceae bacterium]|nr:hypothetical protein [Candidatus Peribacteraceae bacterium]